VGRSTLSFVNAGVDHHPSNNFFFLRKEKNLLD